MAGICYRPPDQEEADEAFFRQLKPHIHCPRLSWRGLSLPETCSNNNTAGHKQPGRFLEGVRHNCLTQVIEELMRENALLELGVKDKEEVVGD